MRGLRDRESSSTDLLDVDSYMQQTMENCLPEELLLEYKEAFQMLDKKRTGKITMRDLATVLCSIGMQLCGQDLFSMVASVVGVEDNLTPLTRFITFHDFLAIMATIATDCVSEDEIQRIFREFDRDGDGFISPKELRELLCRLGDDISDEELQDMMREADRDGDGLVSLDEFIQVMTCSNMTDSCSCAGATPEKESSMDCALPSNRVDDSEPSEVPANEVPLENCCNQESCSSRLSSPTPNMPKRKSSFGKRRKSFVEWLKRRPSKATVDSCCPVLPEYSSRGSCSSASDLESSVSLSSPRKRRSSIAKTLHAGLRTTVMRTLKAK